MHGLGYRERQHVAHGDSHGRRRRGRAHAEGHLFRLVDRRGQQYAVASAAQQGAVARVGVRGEGEDGGGSGDVVEDSDELGGAAGVGDEEEGVVLTRESAGRGAGGAGASAPV